jgi:hypothetical protein
LTTNQRQRHSKGRRRQSDVTTKGRCQCRAIEYEFTGAPKWVMHCHCESCRRAVSSPVATYVGVLLEQFSYLKGEPTYYESSPGVKRYFCTVCGSPMAYAGAHGRARCISSTARWPIPRNGPDRPRPRRRAGNWFEVNDHLPRYAATASKGAKPMRKGPKR